MTRTVTPRGSSSRCPSSRACRTGTRERRTCSGRELRLKSGDGLFTASFDGRAALYPDRVWLKQDPPLRIAVPGLSVRSSVYTVFPPDLCLDIPVELSIEYGDDDRAKVGLYQIDPASGRFHSVGNRYDERTRSFRHSGHRMAGSSCCAMTRLPWRGSNHRASYLPADRCIYVYRYRSGIDPASVLLTVDGKRVKWDYDRIIRASKYWPITRSGRKGRTASSFA